MGWLHSLRRWAGLHKGACPAEVKQPLPLRTHKCCRTMQDADCVGPTQAPETLHCRTAVPMCRRARHAFVERSARLASEFWLICYLQSCAMAMTVFDAVPLAPHWVQRAGILRSTRSFSSRPAESISWRQPRRVQCGAVNSTVPNAWPSAATRRQALPAPTTAERRSTTRSENSQRRATLQARRVRLGASHRKIIMSLSS